MTRECSFHLLTRAFSVIADLSTYLGRSLGPVYRQGPTPRTAYDQARILVQETLGPVNEDDSERCFDQEVDTELYVTPSFKIKIRCSLYVCPGSSCHTFGQNVHTKNQCLYHITFITQNIVFTRRLGRLSRRAAAENSNTTGN
jgi:hypothetical protein